mmetsp:Transcript_13468/g.36289  ORF Transcript_13468/g.36289 Transcript_13468/m.36289 type:complete len:196 (-) Transcript_13468:106-693(-)|eukprot:CAMPEP_0117514238 /NCGR_PEP_ID=MMETSP0784-20121206/29966_1 /TAXON_ID=39447 /ORGANISM="" /LENGTH=195 /DNA_ID=CAMNT_0005310027 /DNA_START=117 /DNA_END=704 /DNA_ORIENTATION=-
MAEDESVRMPEVCGNVITSFHQEAFQEKVGTFVNINIPTFSVCCVDGSHPIEWTMQFKKYKQIYEEQLEQSLSEQGVDVAEFMNYMEQCSAAYGNDENFRALLAQLTASNDYSSFLEVMFNAVRENWVPEEEAAAGQPPPAVQIHEVDVVVPEGYAPGHVLVVEYLGLQHQVVIPDGAAPGFPMRATLQVPVANG